MPATMDPEPYAPVGADLGRSSSAGCYMADAGWTGQTLFAVCDKRASRM